MWLESLVFMLSLLFCFAASTAGTSRRLLLISLDGFRYDLLNSTLVPYITQWAEEGTWFVNGVRSQYATVTAPNHMSIVTGKSEEEHGIVSNYFYDRKLNESFDIFGLKDASLKAGSYDPRWYEAEPIWLTNERQGGKSGVFYWPMGTANYSMPPHRPSMYKDYSGYGTKLPVWKEEVDQVFKALEDTSYTFINWYNAQPDSVLHGSGYYFNNDFTQTMKDLDELFKYLIDGMKARGVYDQVDIILTTDHGHAEVQDFKHRMCFLIYIPDSLKLHVDYEYGDNSIYIFDEKNKNVVYNALEKAIKDNNFDVKLFRKEDIPSSFNYQKNERIGDIILEPGIGSDINTKCTNELIEKWRNGTEEFHTSNHGHDPQSDDMKGILVMRGPSFKQATKVDDVPENIDLYPLMTDILNIKPNPNKGKLDIVKRALREETVSTKGITQQPSNPSPSTSMQNQVSAYIPLLLILVWNVLPLLRSFS